MIREELLRHADPANAAFQAKLTPNVDPSLFLGVRVPDLRIIERKFRSTPEASAFLKSLPHSYYDENMLHGIFVSNLRNFDETVRALDAFLPWVDNWAVCDTIKPVAFRKAGDLLPDLFRGWIASERIYTCRFGINMLMTYCLDDCFRPEYLEPPAAVRSDEYYVRMMIAWFYATALAKRWDETLPYLLNRRLAPWVHNKTIQKALESRRITAEQKAYLKTLRVY